MKNFIKENWFKIGLLATLVIFAAYVFYWFQLRPAQIRKECAKSKLSGFGVVGEIASLTRRNYENCLSEHGLEK